MSSNDTHAHFDRDPFRSRTIPNYSKLHILLLLFFFLPPNPSPLPPHHLFLSSLRHSFLPGILTTKKIPTTLTNKYKFHFDLSAFNAYRYTRSYRPPLPSLPPSRYNNRSTFKSKRFMNDHGIQRLRDIATFPSNLFTRRDFLAKGQIFDFLE